MVSVKIEVHVDYGRHLQLEAQYGLPQDEADEKHERRIASALQASLLAALGNTQEVGGGVTRSTYVIPVSVPDKIKSEPLPPAVQPTDDDLTAPKE